ncbi:uncharacterized protein DS421_19g651310 [Arachis hypogaea]|uniref:Transmembrane protein n=1 Tax=Arachis hypogaea TaxID=3818 RepID=A0A6B9V7C3_ARAHY|nr:uncharacterized protein DS421_19g651310 [Arachis hypogaea]
MGMGMEQIGNWKWRGGGSTLHFFSFFFFWVRIGGSTLGLVFFVQNVVVLRF